MSFQSAPVTSLPFAHTTSSLLAFHAPPERVHFGAEFVLKSVEITRIVCAALVPKIVALTKPHLEPLFGASSVHNRGHHPLESWQSCPVNVLRQIELAPVRYLTHDNIHSCECKRVITVSDTIRFEFQRVKKVEQRTYGKHYQCENAILCSQFRPQPRTDHCSGFREKRIAEKKVYCIGISLNFPSLIFHAIHSAACDLVAKFYAEGIPRQMPVKKMTHFMARNELHLGQKECLKEGIVSLIGRVETKQFSYFVHAPKRRTGRCKMLQHCSGNPNKISSFIPKCDRVNGRRIDAVQMKCNRAIRCEDSRGICGPCRVDEASGILKRLSQLRDCEIGKVQASVEYMVITMFSVWNWKVSQIQVKLQFPVSHRLNSPSPDAMRIRP
jgi:hypothetical protein